MICEDKDNMYFVSPTGDNAHSGTREAPMLTIQVAINASNTAGLFGDVYIAEGTYSESLTLAHGVSLYGGFSADGTNGANVTNAVAMEPLILPVVVVLQVVLMVPTVVPQAVSGGSGGNAGTSTGNNGQNGMATGILEVQ